MGIELSVYDTTTGSDEGRWVEPVDFNGKKIGIRIKILGPDSKRYAEIKNALQKEMYQALAQINNGLEPQKEEPESVREAKFYAALTIDWEPINEKDPILWNGKPFPYSEKNAITLYNTVPLIRSQVKLYCENRRNFTKPGLED